MADHDTPVTADNPVTAWIKRNHAEAAKPNAVRPEQTPAPPPPVSDNPVTAWIKRNRRAAEAPNELRPERTEP